MAAIEKNGLLIKNTYSSKHFEDIIKVRGSALCHILDKYWRDNKPEYFTQVGSIITGVSAGISVGFINELGIVWKTILIAIFIAYVIISFYHIAESHRMWRQTKNITVESEFEDIIRAQTKCDNN